MPELEVSGLHLHFLPNSHPSKQVPSASKSGWKQKMVWYLIPLLAFPCWLHPLDVPLLKGESESYSKAP
jgi:hypothetical protein